MSNNSKLKAIFDRGPDFSKNLFTIKFAEHKNNPSWYGTTMSLDGASDLSYKIEGFEVKQPAASTYKVNVMGRTVTKINSSVALDKIASFEYRLDSSLDLYKAISKMYLNNTYEFIKRDDSTESGKTIKIKKGYDIFIAYHVPFNPLKDDTTKKHFTKRITYKEPIRDNNIRYFLFSNCRIIGQDAIEYDKESAEPVKCRVSFTFDYMKDIMYYMPLMPDIPDVSSTFPITIPTLPTNNIFIDGFTNGGATNIPSGE